MRDGAEVILLIHASGEHSKAWYAWVPELGGDWRAKPGQDDPNNPSGLYGEVNYDQGHDRIPYASL
jgi:hypothetical protein